MQLDIDEIIIKKRIRQNSGDLTSLTDSMEKFGQLHPVIVNEKRELISGFRRIQCAKRLNWNSVFAVIVDVKSEAEKLVLELEENLRRKDFTEEEKIEAFKRMEKLSKFPRLRLLLERIKSFFLGIFKK